MTKTFGLGSQRATRCLAGWVLGSCCSPTGCPHAATSQAGRRRSAEATGVQPPAKICCPLTEQREVCSDAEPRQQLHRLHFAQAALDAALQSTVHLWEGGQDG